MSIVTKQIIAQLEGSQSIVVFFTDCEPDRLKLIEQDGACWIKPTFCEPRKIPVKLYLELVAIFAGKEQFNTDPETICSDMTHDEFMDKYYNIGE